jgi:hypothetical protein
MLLSLGLIESGPNAGHYGQIGWRLTADDGWRCMYGKTVEEIMAPGEGPAHRLMKTGDENNEDAI